MKPPSVCLNARALALHLHHGFERQAGRGHGAGLRHPSAHDGWRWRSERTNVDVVRTICSILDHLKPSSNGSRHRLISSVSDRPGHDRRYAIDPSRIERELGWRTAEAFETGIEKTVQWYRTHPQWWRSILDRGYVAKRIGLAGRMRKF
jgi:nucleoside-diphosphate-sugar epimerase